MGMSKGSARSKLNDGRSSRGTSSYEGSRTRATMSEVNRGSVYFGRRAGVETGEGGSNDIASAQVPTSQSTQSERYFLQSSVSSHSQPGRVLLGSVEGSRSKPMK